MTATEKDLLLAKAMKFCAYQERCQKELRARLYEWKARKDEIEWVIVRCIEEGFVNEERFARAFAGGKFRTKGWGLEKITRELQQKDISAYCIRKALEEISEDDYRQTLQRHLEKKMEQLKGENPFIARKKAADYAIRKGFAPSEAWEVLMEMYPS